MFVTIYKCIFIHTNTHTVLLESYPFSPEERSIRLSRLILPISDTPHTHARTRTHKHAHTHKHTHVPRGRHDTTKQSWVWMTRFFPFDISHLYVWQDIFM